MYFEVLLSCFECSKSNASVQKLLDDSWLVNKQIEALLLTPHANLCLVKGRS